MTPDIEESPEALPLSIHSALASALNAQGYTKLTPVQTAMLDEGHGEADMLVSAQTGSGKTVAFGIAIAPTLLGLEPRFGRADQPLGLVIAPTRELALQVQRELSWLYADAGIHIATCVGGMDMRNERRALERGAHLVVGTPGRLRDHINRGSLDLAAIRAVVLDEADEMLDLGFRDDLEFILAASPEDRRTLMFSATVPRGIAELASRFQRDAHRIAATAMSEQHADIEYQLMIVRKDEREHAIINTLLDSDSKSAMIFCHTREAVRHLTARLANRGFSVVALSGDLAQSERSSALQAMRDGRAHVCVATDVAARGIDLPNLDLVIHADLPSNPATLLHRSGRTGRAGRKGVCVLIVPDYRRGAARRVLSLAKLTATTRGAPTIADIETRYRKQILETASATTAPDEAETLFVEELLEQLTPQQIATAYLRQQLSSRPVPEDISPLPIRPDNEKPERRSRRSDDDWSRDDRPARAERERPPRMEGGVWFTLSVGRKHRADPKWLLPMICKAGGVSKRDIGSIKIEDSETRFEISPSVAEDFAAHLANGGTLEKGLRITRGEGGRGKPAKNWSGDKPKGKPSFKDKKFSDKPARAGKSGKPGKNERKPADKKPKGKGNRPD